MYTLNCKGRILVLKEPVVMGIINTTPDSFFSGSRVRATDEIGVGLVAASLKLGQALRGQKRHPSVEDRVTIYAGATIMGGDTVVGEGSTIGANVFLTHSVPPGSLVVPEEVKIKIMSKAERAKAAASFEI